MRRRPPAVPALTSRRAVLLAAGSALAVPALQAVPRQSYLGTLLKRRDELERLIAGFADAAERLQGSALSPALRRRWRDTRRAEARASQALERLEWVIADTPAETLDDVALKIRFCAELQGYGTEPAGWRPAFTVEEQLLRTIVADLKRLKASAPA